MRLVIFACGLAIGCGRDPRPITEEQLGRKLFDDPALSEPPGQACADCHAAEAAFADPEDDRTSMGAVRGRTGIRNAQPIMYALFVPPLHRRDDRMFGGLFWDGHANTLEAQAALPFTNPLEMNNASKADVVAKVRARYARAFREVYGPGALDDIDAGYERITKAIAAFERTYAFAPFSSKYDRHAAGAATLDEAERRGLALFETHCTSCHPPPLFSTFGYVNLGMPRFRDNPFYRLPPELNPDGNAFVDRGLAVATGDPRHEGMFRIPSLRNVGRTTPYGHNGYFRRLDEMIAFHARPSAPAEVPATVDRSLLAGFTPSKRDIADLVAFLLTLTDEISLSSSAPTTRDMANDDSHLRQHYRARASRSRAGHAFP
jgi:cytochrome c peroxidase